MTEDPYAPRPLAGWFWPAAALSLVLMTLPAIGAAIHLTTDPATLPLDQRQLFEAEPRWMVVAFGLTGLVGAAGALMLLLRRRQAEPMLLVAFLAAAVWFAGMFVNRRMRDLLDTNQIGLAAAVVAIVWTIFWFARHSRQRGWLR